MNKQLVVKALTAYRDQLRLTQPEDAAYGNALWEIQRIDTELSDMGKRVYPYELIKTKGGDWLGVARNWIQRKFSNGESVTWGTGDVLEGKSLTVRDVEELAAAVAAAAINEERELL